MRMRSSYVPNCRMRPEGPNRPLMPGTTTPDCGGAAVRSPVEIEDPRQCSGAANCFWSAGQF